jgi:hypothetical protein
MGSEIGDESNEICFDGAIDNVAIYDRIVGEQEIK